MSKNNNLIRKEVWLTKDELTQLDYISKKKSIHPKLLLEFYVGLGMAEDGQSKMADRIAAKLFSGSKRGTRKSPILSPKKKKLRKVKGALVHAKGSTEIEGQTVLAV